jgi:hypothetical protein
MVLSNLFDLEVVVCSTLQCRLMADYLLPPRQYPTPRLVAPQTQGVCEVLQQNGAATNALRKALDDHGLAIKVLEKAIHEQAPSANVHELVIANAIRVCRSVLWAAACVALSACAPQWSTADWSAYVSKTESLRFIAAADCTTPYPLNPITADAVFSQVTDLRPVPSRPWSYDVSYITGDSARRDRFDVVQWWAAAGTRTSTQYGERHQCAVLVDVPKSNNAARPYFYTNDVQARAAEHDRLIADEKLISYMLAALFIVLLIPSLFGFEPSHDTPAEGKWALAIGAAIGVIGVSLIVGDMCLSEPWRTFEKARQYYTWFDDLPGSRSGLLLPISPQQLNFLVAGPPHPTAMQAEVALYLWVTFALASLWLVALVVPVIRGIYWIATPLPLEQAHRQALHEDRRLTAEEIVTAMNKAVAGKSAWQLNIMRRKAEAFAQTFGYVASQDS